MPDDGGHETVLGVTDHRDNARQVRRTTRPAAWSAGLLLVPFRRVWGRLRKDCAALMLDRRDVRLLSGIMLALSLCIGVLVGVFGLDDETPPPLRHPARVVLDVGLVTLGCFASAVLFLVTFLALVGEGDRLIDWCTRRVGPWIVAFRQRCRASYDLRTDLLRAPLSPGSLTWRSGVINRFERRVARMQALQEGDTTAALTRLARRARGERSRLELYARGDRIRNDVLVELRRSASSDAIAVGNDYVFFAHRAVVGDSFLRAAIVAHEVVRETDISWVEGWNPRPRLLHAPMWVHAALLELAPSIEMDSDENVRWSFGDPITAAGVEPLDVLTLWDPSGDGPFRELSVVVESLRLL